MVDTTVTSIRRRPTTNRSDTRPPSAPSGTSRLHAEYGRLTPRRLRRRPGAKWQAAPGDLLPAWVADMDFPVAEPIRSALVELVDAGDLGYPDWPDGVTPVREAYAARMADRYGWAADPAHVREFSNVAQAAQVVIRSATRPGDGVAIHTPAFGPFVSAIEEMGRRVVPIPMTDDGAGWTFDTERLDELFADCSLLLLVNPHNPTGRVFTRPELTALAEAAERHDVLVISDEIHADLTYAPHRHIPFASLSLEVAHRTVTLYSASKAFNLAGVRCAVAHVGPARVRVAIDRQAGLSGTVSVLAARSTLAAWTQADEWLTDTLAYLDRNRRRVADVIARELPIVGHHPPEATYLAWLDFRRLGWQDDPAALLRDRAGVALSPGPSFNPGGDGFVRLNFATSESVLDDMLDRLVGCARLGSVPSDGRTVDQRGATAPRTGRRADRRRGRPGPGRNDRRGRPEGGGGGRGTTGSAGGGLPDVDHGAGADRQPCAPGAGREPGPDRQAAGQRAGHRGRRHGATCGALCPQWRDHGARPRRSPSGRPLAPRHHRRRRRGGSAGARRGGTAHAARRSLLVLRG